jgi:hypothetical protein
LKRYFLCLSKALLDGPKDGMRGQRGERRADEKGSTRTGEKWEEKAHPAGGVGGRLTVFSDYNF